MLAEGNYYITTVLFVLLQPLFSAMVLPRPPSSPNHIPEDQGISYRKTYEGKSLHSQFQSSNVERPNTNDYSLLEIELQSPDEMDTTSFENIVRVMLKEPEHVQNDSYPNPEVIPHSIFGVRDVGLTSNFKLDRFNQDRHILIGPPKIHNLDEKLYYLKNNGPKVYLNVRSDSGSFRKGLISKTTSSVDPIGYLKVTPAFQKHTDWKLQHGKKMRPPKKFNRHIDVTDISYGDQKNLFNNEIKKLNTLTSIYGLDGLSTTENTIVTSSELPKQIPAPPSKRLSRTLMTQTTPVQRYALRRTDILPGYSFSDA